MKKTLLILAFALLFVPAASNAFDLCWTTGNLIELDFEGKGNGVFSAHGTINGTIPLAGTAVVVGSTVQVSFGLVQASEGSNAVVWQMNLDNATLDGDVYFRWYDGTQEGALVATSIACPPAPEYRASSGLELGIE